MVKTFFRHWLSTPNIFHSLTQDELLVMRRAAERATRELKDQGNFERELAIRAEIARRLKEAERHQRAA